MGRDELWGPIRASPFNSKAHCQAAWHGSAQTCLGTTQSLLHWCCKISVIRAHIAQTGGLAPTSIWVWRIRSNHSLCESRMPIISCPQKISWITVLDDETRCWLNNIAANIWKGPPIRTANNQKEFVILPETICQNWQYHFVYRNTVQYDNSGTVHYR